MRGRVIAGKYELQRQVGQGGMGMVWEALDTTLRRAVAVKLMSPSQVGSASLRARFEREAQALAQIRSEHIVQVHDYGVEDGAPYIVMELLAGEDLEARLQREGKLSASPVVQLLRQVAKGLTEAALLGIVHRDLKPANLFMVAGGARELVKLLDFGVAWMRSPSDSLGQTTGRTIIGTPQYMSPEQVRGHEPSPLGDLWSLAVIAYQALTGQLPFPEEPLGSLIVSICIDPVPPPSVVNPELPKALDGFFEIALAKRPDARFQSATSFIEALADACKTTATTTILAVDDEPDMAHLIQMRFRKQIRSATYRFLFAENGQAALEILRQNPDIDVLLSDINMPVMDGLSLLEHTPELSPFLRTIMVSAYGDMGNIRRAMNVGAFDFVVKPIDFGDLDTTIKKAARTVAEHRAMASSDGENKVLRKLASSVLLRRLSALELNAALGTELIEATVAVIVISRPHDDPTEHPDIYARALNANYEVIVPVVQQHGGMVDTIFTEEIVCAWTGSGHLERALDACGAVCIEVANLAELVGQDSPYSHGLSIGVATGRLLSTCVGSSVGGRFTYTIVGPPLGEALNLARVAQRGHICVSHIARRQAGNRFPFDDAQVDSGPIRLLWGPAADRVFESPTVEVSTS
ncbi:Adenylate cyclase [Enhygromyxa salina]|uniref:Adenylate cyclase n=1 Tax=Enhygromyxa salina TaxID=215803 RepID=A0A0C2CUL7_9BACT|nr:protein kinase [Enhygromyxa salina]KIG13275.1 Adenylate cyclase [Enhygromyxa salina]